MKFRFKTGIFTIVALLGLALAAGAGSARAERITVTDLLGREVSLEKPASRIVLAQGRHLQALSLIHPDPVSLIVGWKEDMKLDSASYAVWKEKFPAIKNIPAVGIAGGMSFSVEKAISLQPDLVVFGTIVGQLGDETVVKHLTDQFSAADIPVVFVDFFVNPLKNTPRSVEILGTLTGRAEQAKTFNDFYARKLENIVGRITAQTARPKVFMQVHASAAECCTSPGRGIFHDFIEAAGGHNIGAGIIPGVAGKVSLEYLIGADPDIYIATGGAHMVGKQGLVLGTGIDAASAQASLAHLLASPGLSDLSAVSGHRAYGIWHLFNDSPVHIVLVEVLAKWFQPETFTDVDPAATLAELNSRFLTVPLEGTYWIGQK